MVAFAALLLYFCSCNALSIFFQGSSKLHQVSEISFLFPDIQSANESIHFVECTRVDFFSFLKGICSKTPDRCENSELRAILTNSNVGKIVQFLERLSNLPMTRCVFHLEIFWLQKVRTAACIQSLDLAQLKVSSCESQVLDHLVEGIPTIEVNLQDSSPSADQTSFRPIVWFKGERTFSLMHAAIKELPQTNSSLSLSAYIHSKGTMRFALLESVSNYIPLSHLQASNEIFYLQACNMQELKSILVHAAQYAGTICPQTQTQLQDLVFFDKTNNWFKIAFPFLVGTTLAKDPEVLYAELESQLLHLEHRHKQIIAQEYGSHLCPIDDSFESSMDINDLVMSFSRKQQQLNWIQNYFPLFHQDLGVLSSEMKEKMISSLQQLLQ